MDAGCRPVKLIAKAFLNLQSRFICQNRPSLSWSSTGEPLALSVNETGYGIEHEIYTVRPDGSDMVKLTDNAWDDAYQTWSPDGMQIAFSSKQYGNYDVFVMHADGSGLRRLITSPLEETTPSWQPPG